MMEKTNEQALQDFLLDIQCLDELLPWTGKFNLFDVLKVSRTEIRHSNVLAWLLNANENHGLGDAYIRGIIQRLVENDSDGRYDVFRLLLLDMYSFSVYREYKNIDILLVSAEEKTLIAIENKVGSHEHSNQLNRYRGILEREYEDYQKIYIFLTPDGEEPSDVENWDVFTYDDVVDVLATLYARVELQPDVALMIRNYIEVVRRDIVEDQQLIEICNKIYNKHKKALDLIFEYRIDGKMQVLDAIRSALKALADEESISYEPEWNYSFHMDGMDEVLPWLEEPISSWGTNDIYTYWLDVREDKVAGIFELAGWNVPEETMETMQKMIAIMKPNDKRREEFKYKRLYRTKWYSLSEVDDFETEADKIVRAIVDELRDMQIKLLEEIC